jgi:hypothetical protein
MRLAALSGSRLPGWHARCENTECAGRSALRAANMRRPFASVMCIAKALKPFFADDGAAGARVDAFLAIAFFAMIVFPRMQPAP